MADGRQWMAWYPGDYLRDTQRLTTEQHGAYTLLLWTYWAEQGPLPDDDEELAMITRLSPERWAQQRGKLERFFEIGDGVWRQKRVEKEIDKAREAVAKARENGRRGGRPKNPDPNPPVKGSVNPSDKGPVKGLGKGLGKGSGTYPGTQNESLPQPQPQPLPSPSSPSEDLSNSSDEEFSSAERRRDSDDPPVDDAIRDWQRLGEDVEAVPTIRAPLSQNRKAKLKARLKQHGLYGWREALNRIRGSPFLRGERSQWAATFDWLISEQNMLKVLEGNYDERDQDPTIPRGNSTFDRRTANVARRRQAIGNILARAEANGHDEGSAPAADEDRAEVDRPRIGRLPGVSDPGKPH